jgi:hypothetical protein
MLIKRLTGRLDRKEDGAVLIIFAISAIVLFGFAAIAVDSAYAFVERRDSQAAADVSAIAGALTLIDNTGNNTAKATDLVTETMDIAARNLGTGLDWAGCSDPDRPGTFNVIASSIFPSGDPLSTQCISWASDWSEVRVRIPTRAIDTFFAGVIGFDTININAFAEVAAVIEGSGGVLPLGVLSGGTNGLVCVKTGPQFPTDCSKSSTGNFDFLDFGVFGNTAMGTTTQCGGSAVVKLKENIAHGVDHDLAVAPSSPTDHSGINSDPSIIKEDDVCPSKADDVQAVLTETGNKQKVIVDGFILGSGGFPGRLTIGSPSRTYTFGSTPIDDVGLWEYYNTFADSACADSEAGVIGCLQSNPGVELFTKDISFSARLAKVPELWQTSWPTGSKYVSFQSFSFVYVQTIYGGCKNSGVCALEIEPGVGGVKKYKNNTDPVAVTAIAIPDSAVPKTVRDSFGAPRVVTYALSR